MTTDGTTGPDPDDEADDTLEMTPAEVGYVLARRTDDYTGCVQELLGMTVWLPVKGADRQLLVTGRGGRRLVRAYTSQVRAKAVAGPDVDPRNALSRPFSELIRQWASDDLGVVVNPDSDTELQLPRHVFPKILQLRERMLAGSAGGTRLSAAAGSTAAAAGAGTPGSVEPPGRIGSFRFAALVDDFDTQGRPVLSDERPRVTDPEEKRRIREYLAGGKVLQAMAGLVPDMFDPGKGSVVPANTRTDGTWIWQDGLAYYLDTYDVGPEPDFYRVIVDRGYACPPVSPARTRLAGRALAEQQRVASQLHHEQQYGDRRA